MYDIIIIGAGPAGLTAALYARRADKKVLVIEKETFGGQITHSPKVENYPGFTVMSGNEFADKLIEQVMFQGAEIELDTVTAIKGDAGAYTVECERGSFEAKSVIIATGSHHRQLGLPKENKFTGILDNTFRHLQIGVEFTPSQYFYIAAGYSWKRNREMSINDAFSIAGLSYGIGINYSRFRLSYSRNEYHRYGAPNYISLLIKI